MACSLLRHSCCASVLGAGLALGCAPEELVVGDWPCAEGSSVAGTPAADSVPAADAPMAPPWDAGFENGFCDYGGIRGYCYADGMGSYDLVRAPVHSGNFAASFTVTGDGETGQARCFREGVLPEAAYYGAWYYLPAAASNAGNWNLFYFQGGSEELHGLWDVSLRSTEEGGLFLQLFDHLAGIARVAQDIPPVPIGSWFHVEFYLERAADATGRVELYQDGELLLTLADLTTDDSDWGQWYVGNLADALTPAESTVYVDDVTIRTTR